MYEIITELYTSIVIINTKHRNENIDPNITDVATCNVIKMVLLDVISVIMIVAGVLNPNNQYIIH